MLNIFTELWRAQQHNKRTIDGLHFPDTFVITKHGQIEWYFISSTHSNKILRKLPSNSSPHAIIAHLKQHSQPFPCVTASRVSTQSHPSNTLLKQSSTPTTSIAIEHYSIDQVTDFLIESKQQNTVLPRDALFLQRTVLTEPNELQNHFFRVIYNTNFIRIEHRRNAFVWENLTHALSHSNLPSTMDRYHCTISYEGPDEITQIEKLHERTAATLKQLTLSICAQLEAIHKAERGSVKQVTLVFKKTKDNLYDLLHCNEILFEQEQHIPHLWRMSFSLPFAIPQHIYWNLDSTRISTINLQQSQQQTCCSACGQITQDTHAVIKNKLQRIRVKRGIRETFNGLLPVHRNTVEKGMYHNYSSVRVCSACFEIYKLIESADNSLIIAEDRMLEDARYRSTTSTNHSHYHINTTSLSVATAAPNEDDEYTSKLEQLVQVKSKSYRRNTQQSMANTDSTYGDSQTTDSQGLRRVMNNIDENIQRRSNQARKRCSSLQMTQPPLQSQQNQRSKGQSYQKQYYQRLNITVNRFLPGGDDYRVYDVENTAQMNIRTAAVTAVGEEGQAHENYQNNSNALTSSQLMLQDIRDLESEMMLTTEDSLQAVVEESNAISKNPPKIQLLRQNRSNSMSMSSTTSRSQASQMSECDYRNTVKSVKIASAELSSVNKIRIGIPRPVKSNKLRSIQLLPSHESINPHTVNAVKATQSSRSKSRNSVESMGSQQTCETSSELQQQSNSTTISL